jgi:hypothetical protein
MRFKIYREYGALNSPAIFSCLEQGLRFCGHEIVDSNEDVAVIWSVLWNGRMANNQNIYQRRRTSQKPTLIVEVGNLFRNQTWRICLNHINALGEFGNDVDLDENRPNKLGIHLKPVNENRRKAILIATQHGRSLQWEGMPPMTTWTTKMIEEIQRRIEYPIYIRPHPRSPMPGIEHEFINVRRQVPQKIANTYDDFDIDFNYHVVINHNSGPTIHAAINGTPVICDKSSLAYPVSTSLDNIQNPILPDRKEWLLKLTHTEWTPEEISKGIPIKRLENKIIEQLNR